MIYDFFLYIYIYIYNIYIYIFEQGIRTVPLHKYSQGKVNSIYIKIWLFILFETILHRCALLNLLSPITSFARIAFTSLFISLRIDCFFPLLMWLTARTQLVVIKWVSECTSRQKEPIPYSWTWPNDKWAVLHERWISVFYTCAIPAYERTDSLRLHIGNA